MLYQCAPDPEDVLASRRLPDGRTLAVFALRVTEQQSVALVREYQVTAGEVIARLRYERQTLATTSFITGYALVVTDDTELPEKWRTLDKRKQFPAIMRLFNNFKVGDDNRRRRQAKRHPHRRAGEDRRQRQEPQHERRRASDRGERE